MAQNRFLNVFLFDPFLSVELVKDSKPVDFHDEGCVLRGYLLLVDCDLNLSLSVALLLLNSLDELEHFLFIEGLGVLILLDELNLLDFSVESLNNRGHLLVSHDLCVLALEEVNWHFELLEHGDLHCGRCH